MFNQFLKFLTPSKKRSQTASIAKERLQIVVSHHRKSKNLPDFVTHLEKDILNVLKKYVEVNADMVRVNLEQNHDESKLELNVTLPQNSHEHETV
jgi:cell division topological specificity factor